MNLNFKQAIFCYSLIHSVIITLASLTNQCLQAAIDAMSEKKEKQKVDLLLSNYSLTRSLTHLLTHSLTHSFTHSFTYSLTHSRIVPYTFPFICRHRRSFSIRREMEIFRMSNGSWMRGFTRTVRIRMVIPH